MRMTSRQRILASIDHKEPDHVPIDLGATPSSGISAIAYAQLKKNLNITNGYTRIYDVVQQLVQPEDEILDYFNVDVVDIGRTFNTAENYWYDIRLSSDDKAQYPVWFRPARQQNGRWEAYSSDATAIAAMPQGATFFDQTFFPYVDGYPDNYKKLSEAMAKVHWSAFAHSPWDNLNRQDFWEQLRLRAIDFSKRTDRALILVCGCNLFEWGAFLRRMDNFLMDLLAEPLAVERFLDALMEQHLALLEKVCNAVGDVADIVRFGDDLGMDTGGFMSVEIYRRFFKPRHAILCDYVHKNSKMKTLLHSCGSIYQFLPDLIEAGYEIINPVQTSARNMEPDKLKNEFGRDITFWGGGCDTRTVLNMGTTQEVKDHVKRRLEIFSPGGGYVFTPIHNIMPDVPPDNILAMFEAVEEFCGKCCLETRDA